MIDHIHATQQAVLSALIVNADVQDVLGNSPVRLYDHVPPNTVFPYAVLSAAHITPYDSMADKGFEHVITLDIFSRYRGGKESRDVFQAFYNVLHRTSLTLVDAVFLSSEFHSADFALTDDGLTYHATARFSIIVQAT